MKPCNIFQLQRLSVNDGDGIRTTVFFKGCHLRCHWCANPESWSFDPQLMFLPHKCVSCGLCVHHCQHNACQQDADGTVHFISSHCRMCGDCIPACPASARQQMGRGMTVQEVVTEVKKDYLFYAESHGGVTFSGGEPYLHPEFLRELTHKCHELGISTCTESCGFFAFEECADIIADMDAMFFDIKMMDPERHRHYTGHDNGQILANIKRASELNPNIVVRVPVIQGVNDDKANIQAMCSFLAQQTRIRKVELLTYHKLGLEKMTALGLPAPVFHAPEESRLQELKQIISSYGIENISYK